MALLSEMEWHRDLSGYQISRGHYSDVELDNKDFAWFDKNSITKGKWTLLSGPQIPRIVPCGGQLRSYKPMELDLLCIRFAGGVHASGDLLEFITKYGLLTSDPNGESIPYALRQAMAMRSWLSSDESTLAKFVGAKGKLITNMDVFLAADPKTGAVSLQYRPENLLAAMWLQLGQKMAGGARFNECRYCGRPFEVGRRGLPRSDATFCSHDHHVFFHNQNRAGGAS
jgi:hypothetical protein